MILVALFLVNLPFAHQTLTERRITDSGREVEATLVAATTINGRRFVGYRLPARADPSRTRYSARVDDSTYALARETRVLAVRVVPGEPSVNRPAGEVRSHLFAIVALTSDVVLALVAVLLWRRWRRWSWHEVVGVGDGLVSLAARNKTLTVSGPEGWTERVQPGDRVSGSLHLRAEEDLLPGLPLDGFEQVQGSSYVVRGRVLDARTGRVVLELADGFRLAVETGPHRVRADIRDSTEVHGNLCFTPTMGPRLAG
jgi:hypothetical protein